MRGVALALLALTGCATMTESEPPPPVAGAEGACSTEALRDLIGRTATAELGAEALRRSGARTIRWIQPGQMITMDYSPARLNIRLDEKNAVLSFDCG